MGWICCLAQAATLGLHPNKPLVHVLHGSISTSNILTSDIALVHNSETRSINHFVISLSLLFQMDDSVSTYTMDDAFVSNAICRSICMEVICWAIDQC